MYIVSVFEIVMSELQARNDSDLDQMIRNSVKYSEELKALTKKLGVLTKS